MVGKGQGTEERSHYVLFSSPVQVRRTLSEIRTKLLSADIGEAAVGTCEIVLAEALNNIVEHAYQDRTDGQIDIHTVLEGNRLCVEITDRGRAMPDKSLPTGALTSLDVPTSELPEGGFGWFLIHTMTEGLNYRRHEGANLLNFEIPLHAKEL